MVPVSVAADGAAHGGAVTPGSRPRVHRPAASVGSLSAITASAAAHRSRSSALVDTRPIVGGVAQRRDLRPQRHRGALAPHRLATTLGTQEPPPRPRASSPGSRHPGPDPADGARESALGAVRIVWIGFAKVEVAGDLRDLIPIPTERDWDQRSEGDHQARLQIAMIGMLKASQMCQKRATLSEPSLVRRHLASGAGRCARRPQQSHEQGRVVLPRERLGRGA